jgi:formate dehydrogenase accessory protein FdhE
VSPELAARRAAFAVRAARARELAGARPAVAEVLSFYATVASAQGELLADSARLNGAGHAATCVAALAGLAAGELVGPFLERLIRVAPPGVVDTLSPLRTLSPGEWAELCDDVARQPTGAPLAAGAAATFVAEAVLQPFAEVWAAVAGSSRAGRPDALTCGCCGGRALAGLMRERGHGAGRSLVCGFCASEWSVPRVICPGCGESRVDALPVFRDGERPEVRIDACDTCRIYVKSIDLSVQGRAEVVVDDLATAPLDLWAGAQGYARPRPNVLRV